MMGSERSTLQGALRFIKHQLGIAVLVGLRDKPYGRGWLDQSLARLSATEQLALLNEAVAATGKPKIEITLDDIRVQLVLLLSDRFSVG